MTNNIDHLNKYFKQTLKPTVRTNVSYIDLKYFFIYYYL